MKNRKAKRNHVACPECWGSGSKIVWNFSTHKYEAHQCGSCEGSGKLEVQKP